MSELIPIREHDGEQAVSGRDLHQFLGLGRDYTNWFKQMISYGFIEDQDFTPILAKTSEVGGRPKTDHALTLDMAKELSMIQRTEKGKQARQYFIECERRAKGIESDPTMLMARGLEAAQLVITQKDEQIAELTPKAEAWDSIVGSSGSWSFNDAAKALFEYGQIVIGEKRLVRWLVEQGYLYRDAKGRPHVYQRYLEQNLFVTKARTFRDHYTGEVRESSAPQVRITGKGLDMLWGRLGGQQLEAA